MTVVLLLSADYTLIEQLWPIRGQSFLPPLPFTTSCTCKVYQILLYLIPHHSRAATATKSTSRAVRYAVFTTFKIVLHVPVRTPVVRRTIAVRASTTVLVLEYLQNSAGGGLPVERGRRLYTVELIQLQVPRNVFVLKYEMRTRTNCACQKFEFFLDAPLRPLVSLSTLELPLSPGRESASQQQ